MWAHRDVSPHLCCRASVSSSSVQVAAGSCPQTLSLAAVGSWGLDLGPWCCSGWSVGWSIPALSPSAMKKHYLSTDVFSQIQSNVPMVFFPFKKRILNSQVSIITFLKAKYNFGESFRGGKKGKTFECSAELNVSAQTKQCSNHFPKIKVHLGLPGPSN